MPKTSLNRLENNSIMDLTCFHLKVYLVYETPINMTSS